MGTTSHVQRAFTDAEQLTPAECWELLRSIRVGRLAVCAEGHPLIFPVNYVVDGNSIVFRTAAGTKLSNARGRDVAFEIDDYDHQTQQASSVILTGWAIEITGLDNWDHVCGPPLFPWDVAPKAHSVRITPDNITGRRFRAVDAGPPGQPPGRG
jgi:uncharacterized protein